MIAYLMPQTGALEQRLWESHQRLDAGELFGLQFSHTFERENILGLAREDMRIREAEVEAGTYDLLYGQYEGDRALLGLPTGHTHAMSEEEYKTSEWYRKRPDGKTAIEYSPNMTPQRAQILADVYDRRQNEKHLLELSSEGSFGRGAVRFGASFLAQLPDPINFVPLAGSLGKGASLGRRIARGAFEGATGAALADAIVFPTANRRGEDFGFLDVAMDIAFGALIGGGFAGIGGAFALRREGKANAEIETTGRELQESLESAGLTPEDAGRAARETVESLKAMPDSLEAARALRRTIGGEDRAAVGNAMEKALLDVADGDAADVRVTLDAAGEDVSLNGNIVRKAGSIEVNGRKLADIIRSGDSRVAAPLPEYRAPEPPQGVEGEMRAWGIDPTDGRSLDEVEAVRLIDEGRADPEAIAELELARIENERVNTREEAALSIAACIAGAA